MVRRRTRAAKTSSSSDGGGGGGPGVVVTVDLLPNGGVASAVPNGSALEDQYFASPKRKDCKIDCGESGEPVNNCDEDEKMCENIKSKGSSPGRSRGGISGRTIGVPLATRSQTRTIENYFKANTATKTSKLKAENVDQHFDENTYISIKCGSSISSSSRDTTDSSSQSPTELLNGDDPHSRSSLLHISAANSSDGAKTEFIFDLSEDTNDTDNTELSDECSAASGGSTNGPHINANFELHRSPMRDSHSSRSSTTDNIFLQEPVLTLNVDKSPNQASSIKINKSLEIEPIFSSPPAITAAVLNGRFNKIVSLNGSPSKRDSFGFETHPILINGNCYALSLDNDNSSCDSGVAFGTASVDTNSPNPAAAASRRRKPATPHRIVCPSPIKTAPRMVSPAGGAKGGLPLSPSGRKLASSKDVLSPRKSQRHLTSAGSKTRRRLNHSKEHQAPYQHQTTTTTTTMQNGCKQNGHIDAQAHIDDGNDDQECENHGDAAAVAVNFCQVPPLITSTKNTTAQQNSIINKSHKTTKTTSGKASAPVQQQHQQPKMKLHQAPQPLAATNGNRELTTFFPVRRSVRKTKTAVKEEMMRNLEQAILEERAEGLKVAHFEGKGRGIVADRRFERGEFVVEYVGDLISMTEAAEREKQYALDENAGCYMYYFKHKNQQYCIDATIDTGKLGRLVNHSRTGNLITKVVVVKQRPHLILIAKDDIEPGEELTYDYGDRSKESLLHHPWLAF